MLFRLLVNYPLVYPLQVNNGLYEPLHTGGALLLHALGNVTVYVEGKGGGVVSKILLNGLYIIPGLQGRDSERMPHIMETRFRQANLTHKPLVCVGQGAVCKVVSEMVCKNKVAFYP